MRTLILAAGAALTLTTLAASPALAGGPRGGGCGHCGPAPAPAPHPGPAPRPGGGYNININAAAHASASASASASSYGASRATINARTYDFGQRGGGGGGVVYVGGGYGGDVGYVGGGAVYREAPLEGRACASAPFGYAVQGYGRVPRPAAPCGYHEVGYRDAGYDRGGRYGYSERHESRYEAEYRYREERHEEERWSGGWTQYDGGHGGGDYGIGDYERGYVDGRRDCDCRAEPAPPPPPAPIPAPAPPPYRPPAWDDQPLYPLPPHEPAHDYRQEPGERG